ncbi:MAG: DNA polymerase III subunit gamma/tau, partial [Atopobiaceae bacterium]|nr:DNA polymerase III subunit gamma/tau [Atopobiaceae bacterium]
MESLYRKYRPLTFDDVVGQQHVVSTLEHAVTEDKVSHAYLCCGPRGTGKTTMARILAKALLCEKGAGQLPDGTCEECKLIAAGEHPDVLELDAASRTGVDNVREEIINRVDYAPARGRFKVYIIDEVHMLTTQAFNALLKTLEEPPSHVIFVLCTTDPQKVPETILSRVQRFDFHAISSADIVGRLAYVCDKEGFSYDEEALTLVARHARGGMRDALSTLEQLSVFGDGAITVGAARDLLGETSSATLDACVEAVARRDVPAIFDQVATLVDEGRDPLQFCRELTARVRDLYVVSVAGARDGVVSATPDELADLAAQAKDFGSPDRLSRVLCVLGEAATDMRMATNQRLSLEVALTRIARPQADLTIESLGERVAALEAGMVAAPGGGVQGAVPVAAPASAPATRPAPAPAPQPAPVPTSQPASAPATRPVPAPASR